MRELEQLRQKQDNIWGDFIDWMLFRTSAGISVISIPAEAHLLLRRVPLSVQKSLGIAESEEVVLSGVSGPAYSYRDALMLADHTRVLAQDLCEGTEATVLSLSSDTAAHEEELHLVS
jgi:hypothetical protein